MALSAKSSVHFHFRKSQRREKRNCTRLTGISEKKKTTPQHPIDGRREKKKENSINSSPHNSEKKGGSPDT